jgi:hypothetical protein
MSATEAMNEERPSARGSWEQPTITEFALHTRGADEAVAQAAAKAPEPPAEPMVKLGFSFEASFPLSARTTAEES